MWSGRNEGHMGESGTRSTSRKASQIFLEFLKSEAYLSDSKRTRKEKTHNAKNTTKT
jgi:hypothetical protein